MEGYFDPREATAARLQSVKELQAKLEMERSEVKKKKLIRVITATVIIVLGIFMVAKYKAVIRLIGQLLKYGSLGKTVMTSYREGISLDAAHQKEKTVDTWDEKYQKMNSSVVDRVNRFNRAHSMGDKVYAATDAQEDIATATAILNEERGVDEVKKDAVFMTLDVLLDQGVLTSEDLAVGIFKAERGDKKAPKDIVTYLTIYKQKKYGR